MKKFTIILIGILYTNLFQIAKAQLCYPMNIGGIVPGISLDRDVVALYGKGFFNDIYGHGGGRVYTNSSMTSSVIVEIGVDHYIEAVWIKEGLEFPDSVLNNLNQFVAKNFDFTNNGKLRVGLESTKEKIKTTYGIPTTINDKGNIWSYESKLTDSTCYINSSISFWFTNDKVTTLIIASGEE